MNSSKNPKKESVAYMSDTEKTSLTRSIMIRPESSEQWPFHDERHRFHVVIQAMGYHKIQPVFVLKQEGRQKEYCRWNPEYKREKESFPVLEGVVEIVFGNVEVVELVGVEVIRVIIAATTNDR